MELKLIKLEDKNYKEILFNIIKKLKNKSNISEYGYTGIIIDNTVYYNENINAEDLLISIHKELIIPGNKTKKEYEELRESYSEEIMKCKNTISAIEYEETLCVYEDSYYTHEDYQRSIKKEEEKIKKYQELIDTIFYYQVCTQCATIGNCMGGEIFTCKQHLIYR